MENIKHLLYNYLINIGLSETSAKYLNMIGLLIILLIIVFIVDFVVRKIIISVSHKISKNSKTKFDDLLISNKVPRNVAHIIPLILALNFIPVVFSDFLYAENIIEKGLKRQKFALATFIDIASAFDRL